MKLFVVGFFVVACAALAVLGAPRVSKCYWHYPGNGGVFKPDMSYIPNSVMVWVDVATHAKKYAVGQGHAILNRWCSASAKFNYNMMNNNTEAACVNINDANQCFADVAPYIIKKDLSDWFTEVNTEFGPLLQSGNFSAVNDYMIRALPNFNKHTNC